MRLIFKGYAITTFGGTHMTISDPSGKEVFRSDKWTKNTEEELKKTLKDFVKGGKEWNLGTDQGEL